MYRKSIDEVFKIKKAHIMGLNDFEVKQRIKKYGYNEIAKDNVKNPIKIFFKQLIESSCLCFISWLYSFTFIKRI